MQNSINKSQQLDYSNCKLSPILFYPETIQRDKNDFFLDNRNRLLFLQSSMVSGKMGIIEPNLGTQYFAKLKDIATPNISDSKLNSKWSKNALRKDENSAFKRSFSSFEHPWNTRNMTFNSNQNFKALCSNNFVNNMNNNSSIINHNHEINCNNKKSLSGDDRNRRETNEYESFQKQLESTPNFLNNSNARPQVFSSILKIRKVENVITNDVPISNYNNFNYNAENKYIRDEKYDKAQNNVNLTIINNNNFNMKKVIKNDKKRKGGKDKKRWDSAEKLSEESYGEENEIKLTTKNRRCSMKNEIGKEDISKRKGNWKKVIEICRGKI